MATRALWGFRFESREAQAAKRREAWQEQKESMGRYLSSPQWFQKRNRAFLIWRTLGWLLVTAPLAAHVEASRLTGDARIVLAWPVQLFAAFGLAYAAVIRGLALAQHRRVKRVGHHLGYTHVRFEPGDESFRHCRERWWEIVPVTERVNKMECDLRRGKPSPGFRPYLRRTLVALAICRFWWVWIGLSAAFWAVGALRIHRAWGTAVWLTGASHTLTWLEMVGHRI